MKIANLVTLPLALLLSVIITDISIILNIPIYRQVFGFLLVTLIPGLLITYILNLEFTCPSYTVLYSVGFSVALTMFLGFLVNLIGPLFGIDRPISIVPLLFSINIAIILLLIASFVVNPEGDKYPIDLRESFLLFCSPQGSFLLLILLLGILGGFAVNYYICSLFSVVAMFLIAVVASLIAFDKFFEEKHHTIALFVIGLTLLLNHTLTSPYLNGSDIYVELFFQKLTEINAYWGPSIYPNTVNTMLSTVILPTVYSLLMDIDTILVYKVVFSLLFALVPVALYHLYKNFLKPKFSFFSVFLFISFYAFFLVLTWLPRQQVAELFLALLLLTLFEKGIRSSAKGLLTITWISSIVVSHYATMYITLFFLFSVSVLLYVFREKATSIKLSTTVFGIIIALSWYIYISLSKTFESIVQTSQRISMAAGDEFFSQNAIDPSVNNALGGGLIDLSFWHALGHLWQIGTQIFIFFGFTYVILKFLKKRSQPEFVFISVAGMLLLFMSITLPFFASSLSMDRIFHICLIFISPLCVIGVIYPMEWISRILKIHNLQMQKLILICLSLLFVPYFLFNSGAIFEVTENSNNFALKIDQTKDYSHYYSNSSYYFLSRVPGEDVVACEWISSYRTVNSPIYADSKREGELWGYGLIPFNEVMKGSYPPGSGGYFFVGRQNIIDNLYISYDKNRVHTNVNYNFDEIWPYLNLRNLVYSNGAAIYN